MTVSPQTKQRDHKTLAAQYSKAAEEAMSVGDIRRAHEFEKAAARHIERAAAVLKG